MTVPTYQECLNAGMTVMDTARARGVSHTAVRNWAKRNGVKFRRDYTRVRDIARQWMIKHNADPEFVAAKNRAIRRHLDAMTDAERADYRYLLDHGYRRNDALIAVGRNDLVRK